MSRFRKLALIALIAVAGIAAIAGFVGLRRSLIDGAQADLQARGYVRIDIIGMRVPCVGTFDAGVAVVLWRPRSTEAAAGRLCRPLAGSGEWTWHPDHGGFAAK
jgi:hypothetical protein